MHLTEGVLAAAALFIISQCVVRVDSWVPDVQSKIRIPYGKCVSELLSECVCRFIAAVYILCKTILVTVSSGVWKRVLDVQLLFYNVTNEATFR